VLDIEPAGELRQVSYLGSFIQPIVECRWVETESSDRPAFALKRHRYSRPMSIFAIPRRVVLS